MSRKRTMAAFVFPGFQTLDFFGPIEMLGDPTFGIEIITVARTPEPVVSRHGQRIVPDRTLSDGADYDILFLPGGDSALIEAKDPEVLSWISDTAAQAERVLAVCTGTVLLGISGAIDGRRATTNKLDFTATVPLAPAVDWVAKARWVKDGKFYTSSGVSAGMDMALAVVADLFGERAATETADGTEYIWNRDANDDPFAAPAGLL